MRVCMHVKYPGVGFAVFSVGGLGRVRLCFWWKRVVSKNAVCELSWRGLRTTRTKGFGLKFEAGEAAHMA